MNWAEWWFLNGGMIHRCFKYRKWSELRSLATQLPKAAWDEQQKKIDALEKENKELRAKLFVYTNATNNLLAQRDNS
jgi:hypothetical protein